MVVVQQGITLNRLSRTAGKLSKVELNINRQLIENDIASLDERLQSIKEGYALNKAVHEKNLSNIIDYLGRILKKSTKPLEIKWVLKDNILRSTPVELKSIPEYKVYMADYVDLTNEKMVSLDYKELADIIAYEIMFRDLGENHDSIEDKLKNIGIIGTEDSCLLTQYFDESPYELSKILRIGESPYIAKDKHKINDYFGHKEFDITTYREVVGYSCKIALSLVVEEILQKCNLKGITFKLCNISETAINILIDSDVEYNVEKEFAEPVQVRAFGRKFEVKPKVQLF